MIKEAFLLCALAVPATTWKPPLTEADLILHEFMARMTQSRTSEEVLFIKSPWQWERVVKELMTLAPGGFALIQGRQWRFHDYFKDHGWMHMPFMWRDFHVYKKPLYGGLFLVKGAA